MQLRSNQVTPTEKGIEFFQKSKVTPGIIVAPTAFGKSWLIAKIAESIKDNVLILQPTKELLEQNYAKYIALGGRAKIYSASFGVKQIGSVTYATIGSIKNIGKRFKAMGFTKMIIDECHLYPRSEGMLGKFLADSEITHVLGATATPLKLQNNVDVNGNRYSKLVMLTCRSKHGQFFKHIVSVSQISEMVELKYWCQLVYEQYDIDDSGLVYNSTKADFTEESLKAVYSSNNTDEKILTKIADEPTRKSIIVFVPSVANAKALADKLPGSAAVYGDMDAGLRDMVIRRFKMGLIRVIFNVNVLSVGFDHPGIDMIICGRPTASLAWFYQALGRGTRIMPGKLNCLIVDFSKNVKRFGPIEKLYYKQEGATWKLYGEGGKLLTGVPLHEIGLHIEGVAGVVRVGFGKYRDFEVKDTPAHWRKWIMDEFNNNDGWNKYNMHVKKEIERIQAVTV